MATEREDTTPHAALAARSRVRRHPERARPEQAEEILRAGRVAHVGFVTGGQPFVIPMTYSRSSNEKRMNALFGA